MYMKIVTTYTQARENIHNYINSNGTSPLVPLIYDLDLLGPRLSYLQCGEVEGYDVSDS